MSHLPVFSVEVAGVAQLETLHNPGQRHFPGLQQQMDLVAHENVRTDLNTLSLSIALQRLEVILPIGVSTKDHLPLVAAANDM
jgi:hypothetical protein